MRGSSPFAVVQPEAVTARASPANGHRFRHDSHSAVAHGPGLGDDNLEAVFPGGPDRCADAAIKLVVAYIDKLDQAPATVLEVEVDKVLQAGWDETVVHHAALVCGFCNLLNRWSDGLGLECDPQAGATPERMPGSRGKA